MFGPRKPKLFIPCIWDSKCSIRVNDACVFISHHVLETLFDELDLPNWCLINKFLSLFWNEIWKDVFLAILLIFWMEYSLNVYISHGLVEVNRKEEVSFSVCSLKRRNNNVFLTSSEIDSS